MKTICLHLLLSLLLASCGVKTTKSLIGNGDYDDAIHKAVVALKANKDSKGKQDYVYLLEEAFFKAKERDLRQIDLWKNEAIPANAEKIFVTYQNLEARQEKIRPILPLKLLKVNRNAKFELDDYNNQLIESKRNVSKYLYENASKLILTGNKNDSRIAFDDLQYLEKINPGYQNTKNLLDKAQAIGTDFVYIYTTNMTNLIIPARLQRDLLDMSTYGLNDKWTVYHNERQKETTYDYNLIINFKDIQISPQQITEKEFSKEKKIKDGLKNAVDARGNVIKDSLGKPVKVDKYKTIRITIFEFSQFKSCVVNAKVDFLQAKNNQLIQSFPISSKFVFDHMYSTYKGDKNACEQSYWPSFSKKVIPFPTDEQMIYDTSEDLKLKIKDILVRNISKLKS